MQITRVVTQLRTTNLAESIRFYTTVLDAKLEFEYEDFYAGIRLGNQAVHLKLVDETDPSIAFVREGQHFDLYLETDDVAAAAATLQQKGVPFAHGVHDTPWGTRDFIIEDDQGHTLRFSQPLSK